LIIDFFTYLLRFAAIILLQVLVINNIQLSTYINPYIYIVFILSLPISTKPWAVLVISLLAGAVMDSFSNTPGLHMAATVFMGYMRRFYLQFSTNKEDLEGHIEPGISSKGFIWFITYAFIMCFMHHFILFFLEAYNIMEFFSIMARVLMSTIFTVLIICIGQLLFYRIAKAKA